jgi:hypothetical protein
MMPSSSKKQHNFMAAIAHSPSFAKKVGVPQSVGKDFTTADKGRKFSKGGDTMATKKMNPFAKFEASAKDKAMDKKEMMGMKKGGMKKMAAGGLSAGHKSADGIVSKGKTKAKQVRMSMGGKAC